MNGYIEKLVTHLLSEAPALSRNKHFETFETPEGKEALRMAKRLKRIRHDVMALTEQTVVEVTVQSKNRWVLRFHILNGTREMELTEFEFSLLNTNENFRKKLKGYIERPPSTSIVRELK